MPRRTRIAALLVTLLVGCSPTTTPSPATPGPVSSSGPVPSTAATLTIARTSACSLIFKAEAADAIGVEIADTLEVSAANDETGWLSDCAYRRQIYADQTPMELTLAAGDRYVALYDDLKGQDGVSSAAGLGDEALLRMTTVPGLPGPVGSISVRIGNAVLGVALGIVGLAENGDIELAGDASTQERVLRDLATLALTRLTGPPEVSAKTCELLSAPDLSALVGLSIAAAIDADEHDVWGPACRYMDATGPNANEKWIDFWIAVSSTAAARAHADDCRASGTIVPGLGDDAFFGCDVKIGFSFSADPLIVRTGDRVIAVGNSDIHGINGPDTRDKVIAVARALLAKLGGTSATPPPVQGNFLAQPCALLTDAEVGSIVGAKITEHFENSADAGRTHAICQFTTGISGVDPLLVTLGQGDVALGTFNGDVKRNPNWQPLAGLGDEAFTQQTTNETDQPLVAVTIRKGDLVLELRLGPIRQSADFLSYVAPGTPDQQITMLRQLVGLILPRILGS